MITIVSKPEFINAEIVDGKLVINSNLLNKKIKITARYKCCYSDCVDIIFKENDI